jgi:uncharacterized protein involved in copper resistance
VSTARLAISAAVLALALPLTCSSAMSDLMGMDDAAPEGKVMLDQLELEGGAGGTALAWEGQAWYGGDYNKVRAALGSRSHAVVGSSDRRALRPWPRSCPWLGRRGRCGAGPILV